MERKVLNDAVAYLRSLAQLRGRNADWAETAVREGATAALAAFYRPCPFPAAPAQPALRRHQSDRPDGAAQMDALPAPDGQISIMGGPTCRRNAYTCNSRMSVAAIRQHRRR